MADKTPPPPTLEQKTQRQSNGHRIPTDGGGGIDGPIAYFADGAFTPGPAIRKLMAGSASGSLAGMPEAPSGSYDTYRRILTDPTVQIGRAVIFGPILASPWKYQPRNKDVPSEIVDFIRSQYEPIEASLKTQLLRSLDFGSRSFEQVFTAVDDQNTGRTLIGIKKFKPLRPENTQVIIEETGEYAGLMNGDVELLPEETLHFAYDMEDDDYYGRSRLENVRERAWWPHMCLERRLGQLAQKVSQIIPVVKGPLSQPARDGDGKEISGYDAGQIVLNALVYGDGVLVENLMAAVDDIIGNPGLEKISKWDIESFDTGQSASGIDGLINALRYYDSLKMRGMLRPERTATEGQHGTKAEVAEQADVGLAEGEQLHLLMAQAVNWHSVNRLLVWNFGQQWENAVSIVPTPLIDEKIAVFRWLFQALVANPAVLDLVVANLDMDAVADGLGIPVLAPLNVAASDFVDPTTQPPGIQPIVNPATENLPVQAA
jgi:hypothetical protein